MIFNSLPYIIFFISFYILYWFVCRKNLKVQNFLLLIGNYFFYFWADWRLLSYLIGISILNFYLGIAIEKAKNEQHKKWFLNIAIIQGIGGLFYFKYFNFFIESFNDLFHVITLDLNLQTLQIIIPLGISFFTFKTISYILDINKGKIKACHDWVVFFSFVSFFPTLLSGPIDKAREFIPQLEEKRVFNYRQSLNGLQQILWGLLKKVVVADNLALATNLIFGDFHYLSGGTLLFGAFLYTIQIYADFSGYSDMAIGFSRLIGFNVTKNFDFPYFSQNIADFWRRWHISLTSWLTEYLFTPLSIAFRDLGKYGLILAIVINFTIVGVWHGANWTFVLFGFLHGLYFIPLIIKGKMNKKHRTDRSKLFPSIKELINMISTFVLVMFTFVIFRSENIWDAFSYLSIIFSKSIFAIPIIRPKAIILLIMIFIILTEWLGRKGEYALDLFSANWAKPIRWGFYYMIAMVILLYAGKEQAYIYFQF